jgi:hypothetical protein
MSNVKRLPRAKTLRAENLENDQRILDDATRGLDRGLWIGRLKFATMIFATLAGLGCVYAVATSVGGIYSVILNVIKEPVGYNRVLELFLV